MKIKFNVATCDSNSRIHTVVVNNCMFGVLVIRKQKDMENRSVWSVFNKGGILVEGGYGDDYDSIALKNEIESILTNTLKEEHGYA